MQFDRQNMKKVVVYFDPSEATVDDIYRAIEAGGDIIEEPDTY